MTKLKYGEIQTQISREQYPRAKNFKNDHFHSFHLDISADISYDYVKPLVISAEELKNITLLIALSSNPGGGGTQGK